VVFDFIVRSNVRHRSVVGRFYSQKESRAGVIFVLVYKVGEVVYLGHWGSGDGVQGDDGFGIRVNNSESGGKGGLVVEPEEVDSKFSLFRRLNGLSLASTPGSVLRELCQDILGSVHSVQGYSHGGLCNDSPYRAGERVAESVNRCWGQASHPPTEW
jgi:hypothetical protein